MKVLIRSSHLPAGRRLRDYVLRRLRFSLGRFPGRVDRATVYLADVNGPRGGEDKVCRVDVRLSSAGSVFVEETSSGIGMAVSGAMERLSRAVAKALARRRDLDRASRRWVLRGAR